MIRPMWLYLFGGIYMDLDYVINKPLDELFADGKELMFVKITMDTVVKPTGLAQSFERDMNKINVKGGVVTCNSSDNGNQLALTIYNEKNYR